MNELAVAATERVEELLESLQKKRGDSAGSAGSAPGQSYVPCRRRGVKEMGVDSLEEAVIIGSYYDHVEAAVVAVYGKTSRVDAWTKPAFGCIWGCAKQCMSKRFSPIRAKGLWYMVPFGTL